MKRSIFKSPVFFLTIMIMVCLIFPGCCNKAENKLTCVNLNEVTHSIFYAPQYVAIEKDYFKDEGIELNVTTGFGSDKVMTSLISGDSDIGLLGPEACVYVYSQGSTDYSVMFAQLTQRAGNFLVSRDNKSNFKWDDVKGKEIIGGRAGGMPQMILEYILKKNNIEPGKDVTIIQNVDFGSTAAAFSSGIGDYTVEFEPSATILENSGDGYVAASLGVDSGYVPYTGYCANVSYLNQHKDVIQSFTNAIEKGLDYVNTHSAREIAEVIAPQFPETDTDTIEKIVDRYKKQSTWKDNTVFTKESFSLLTEILKNSGELSTEVPYEDIINTDFSGQ